MGQCQSGYTVSAYQSGYSPILSSCDECPGTVGIQAAYDLAVNPSISTSGSTPPDYISITIFSNPGGAPTNLGNWLLDVANMRVHTTVPDIMSGEPVETDYPITSACLPTCRATFDYWYNL